MVSVVSSSEEAIPILHASARKADDRRTDEETRKLIRLLARITVQEA